MTALRSEDVVEPAEIRTVQTPATTFAAIAKMMTCVPPRSRRNPREHATVSEHASQSVAEDRAGDQEHDGLRLTLHSAADRQAESTVGAYESDEELPTPIAPALDRDGGLGHGEEDRDREHEHPRPRRCSIETRTSRPSSCGDAEESDIRISNEAEVQEQQQHDAAEVAHRPAEAR